MAKRTGASQQLQVDIETEEELDRFLEKPGLCLLDVYTEWCGPCIAMITTLKKAKLEWGDESFYLATCKSDTIESLARFRNKSEPTWLFVTSGKAISITFGSEIPKLLTLIGYELNRVRSGKTSFPDALPLRELLPIEKIRFAKIQGAAEKARLAKELEIKKKRLEYLNYCTGEIESYLFGFGVTLLGPHIDREYLNRILDMAETEKITVKDRKTIKLSREHIEVLHYACNNPISEEALEQMYGKEIIVCYWKIQDGNKQPVEEVLSNFVGKLIKSQPTDDGLDTIPPILKSLEVKIKGQKEGSEPEDEQRIGVTEEEDVVEEDDFDGDEEELDFESHPSVVVKKSSSFLYIANVPAMWTPANRKTTAAAIYVFFRNQTTGFLPPDPIPEPPHLIVVFDAWKRRDVTDVMNKYTDEILGYGYFTTEEPETAKLIAISNAAYNNKQANRLDKLVLKVAKKTSNAVLALASHGPTYVSPNTDIGKTEAKIFFPEDYYTNTNSEPEPTVQSKKENSKAKGLRNKSKEKTASSVKDDVSGVETDVSPVESDGSPIKGVEPDVSHVEADVSPVEADVSPVEGDGSPIKGVYSAKLDSSPVQGDESPPEGEAIAVEVPATE